MFHWMIECHDHKDEKKRQYRTEFVAITARDGPSKLARLQTSAATSKSVIRLHHPANDPTDNADWPSCQVAVQDVWTTLDVVGRCDDGSKEPLTFKELAEKAARGGNRKLKAIETVYLKVTLTKESETTGFPFFHGWNIPSTFLHLSSGRPALKNTKFFVADENCAMVCEDLLIGLPVWRYLRLDTQTLLEAGIQTLEGTDCSLSEVPPKMGKLGRLMTVCLNRQCDEDSRPEANRPTVKYHKACLEEDPLPDPSLLDPSMRVSMMRYARP